MAQETATATAETTAPSAAPKDRLKGKVVLVTGATRGIGRAIAHAAAAEGAKVAICGRNKRDLTAVHEEIKTLGAECCAIKIDLTDYESAIRLVDAVTRAFGRIDVLINNAGILGPMETIAEYPADDWKDVIDTNLNAVYWVTKEALGRMIPQNSGSILMVTSGVSNVGKANWGAYSVSKFAVEGMMQVLADELKTYKVRVNSINPGPTNTAMRAQARPGEDSSGIAAPTDVTNIFVYLASDASAGVNGERFEAADWMGREDF